MAYLGDIEKLLDCDVSTLYTLNPGLNKPYVNKYYSLPNEIYVLKLYGGDKWIIVDESDDTQDILKDNIIHSVSDYGQALTKDGRIRSWAELRTKQRNILYKNGIRYDNRLVNITKKANEIYMKSKRHNNTSGYEGVRYEARTKNHIYWVAKILRPNGGTKTVSYNVKKYGYDEAFRLAVIKRRELEIFYNYVRYEE